MTLKRAYSKRFARALGLAIVSIIPGCAGVEYKAVPTKVIAITAQGDDDANAPSVVAGNKLLDSKEKGIRYYDTSLYVILYPDGKGGVKWQIVELPDQTKLRTLKPYNYVAQLDASYTFVHGTLAATSEQVDTTAAIRSAISSIAQVLPAIATMFANSQPSSDYTLPPIQVYKFVVDGGMCELVGGPANERIHVTLNPDAKIATENGTKPTGGQQ